MTDPVPRLTVPQAMEQAVAAYEAGRLEIAAQICQQVLAAVPDHLDAVNLMGALFVAQGRPAQALECFSRAVAIAPDFAEAYNNLGAVQHRLGQSEEALRSFKRALDRKPGYAEAIFNKGLVFADQHRWPESLASFQRVIMLTPNHAGAHKSCANVLVRLDRHEEALREYDRALQLSPQYPEAHCNRAIALKEMGRVDEALAGLSRALELRSDYPEALNQRGIIDYERGDWDAAMARYRRAAELRPEYAEPYLNQAIVHMMLGELERAWPLFEWRSRVEDAAPRLALPQPRWTGIESLAGRSIVVHAEEGFGDTIQYARYVSRVEALGASVVFAVAPQLVSLMSCLSPAIRVVPIDQPVPAADYHCPLMSLAAAFRTTLETIPPPARLRASEARIAQWRERLGERRATRIGIAWSGNPRHRNDRNRSIALARLASVLAIDAEFHALQKQVNESDKQALAEAAKLRAWGDSLADFEDSAALIDAMDLVLTVDTSVAHLAASLGKPTWILLPHRADCRWMLDRADSPWYPAARLFRQPVPGDWDSVIEAVAAALRERSGPRG